MPQRRGYATAPVHRCPPDRLTARPSSDLSTAVLENGSIPVYASVRCGVASPSSPAGAAVAGLLDAGT
jgi:hypothetical protein